MDNIIYNSVTQYYKILKRRGYHSYADVMKLMVLCFYNDFVYTDYRGLLSKKDYLDIEKALNCLFGSSCLIPYPDYLKMGKLYLGQMTEMAQRVKTLEDNEVLKAFDAEGASDSDIIITSEEEDNE